MDSNRSVNNMPLFKGVHCSCSAYSYIWRLFIVQLVLIFESWSLFNLCL